MCLGEVTIQIPWLFFKSSCPSSIIDCKSSRCVRDTSPLSDTRLTHIYINIEKLGEQILGLLIQCEHRGPALSRGSSEARSRFWDAPGSLVGWDGQGNAWLQRCSFITPQGVKSHSSSPLVPQLFLEGLPNAQPSSRKQREIRLLLARKVLTVQRNTVRRKTHKQILLFAIEHAEYNYKYYGSLAKRREVSLDHLRVSDGPLSQGVFIRDLRIEFRGLLIGMRKN